jgi:adenosylmethionine-8-amino-7-oxononanoate aminotransferase
LVSDERVRHFRQCGMIWACDAVVEGQARTTFARRFFAEAARQELLLRPIDNTVYLMPPYILAEEEISLLASRTHSVLDHVLSES